MPRETPIVDWDDAYANRNHIEGGAQYPARFAAAAEAFRREWTARGLAELDLAYGEAERQRIDLFRPPGEPKGLLVFVHGGYWMAFDKSSWSHLAAGPLARGWAVAMPSYTLAPAARVREITREIGRAIAYAAGLVGGELRLAGHSAGGHLVMRMICDDGLLGTSRPTGVVSISGVHDLRPLLRTQMNATLRLDAVEAAAESVALLTPIEGAKVVCWVGADERPEFLRQTDLLANIWTGLGAATRAFHAPGKHHFNVIDDLTDSASELTRTLRAMSEPPREGAEDGAKMNFRDAMSYGDYLSLDRLLTAQKPLSSAHDEMLFIIQHQTSELWMKLAIHELRATCRRIGADELQPAFKMLSRIARIFEQLNSAWDVLRSMTPSEYTSFRDELGASSGFQSYQYRLIEFLAGNKNAAQLRPHEHVPAAHAELSQALSAPSLYDETLRLLARRGFAIDAALVSRDFAVRHEPNDSVREAWRTIYRDPMHHWELYELAEKLIDFEDYFRRWRFNHVTTVERVIGFKRGTGGTSGVAYLRRMLEVVLFPELWQVRTEL